MPHHPDGGYSLPETVHMRDVTFCHDGLWNAFNGWLASRGLNTYVFPPSCSEEDGVNCVHYMIGIEDVKSSDKPITWLNW